MLEFWAWKLIKIEAKSFQGHSMTCFWQFFASISNNFQTQKFKIQSKWSYNQEVSFDIKTSITDLKIIVFELKIKIVFVSLINNSVLKNDFWLWEIFAAFVGMSSKILDIAWFPLPKTKITFLKFTQGKTQHFFNSSNFLLIIDSIKFNLINWCQDFIF